MNKELLQEIEVLVGEDRYKLKNKKPRTITEVITRVVKGERTYYTTNQIQCVGYKNRSWVDILRVLRFHFPKSSLKSLLTKMLAVQKDKFCSFYCPDIKLLVMYREDVTIKFPDYYDKNKFRKESRCEENVFNLIFKS